MEMVQSIHLTRNTARAYVEKLSRGCNACGHCCRYGSGYVVKEDIERISGYLGITQEEFVKSCLELVERFATKIYKIKTDKSGKPYGSCIFFRPNACIIHDVKPLHCRLATGCGEYGQQLSLWFMLNHFVNPHNPESIRQYALYLKTHPTLPGGELHELIPDKERLRKILNYEIL
ncbi:MAG: YkgJ family cysteine cluster protein [Candidatus Woesearchaeota archaeon]